MGWSFDDLSAADHEGYLARVLPDGTRTGTWGTGIPRESIAVETSCECGWTGKRWKAPKSGWMDYEGVDAHEDAAQREWVNHVYEVLPAFRLKEAARRLEDAKEDVENAVHAAIHHGFSWSQVGEALGMSKQAAWERYH